MQLFKQSANSAMATSTHKKFWWISVLIIFGMMLMVYFAYSVFSNSLFDERKSQTKHLSTAAMGIIEYYHTLSVKGLLSESDAKRHALAAVKSATYDETGYFWINDVSGTLLMHPYNINKVDSNLLDITDKNGFYYMQAMINTAISGGGWIEYAWPKPNTNQAFQKHSYVKQFMPWNWILGTGFYLDDVQKSIFKAILKESLLLFLVFLTFFFITLAYFNIFAFELETLAIIDGLTGLYTKRYLTEITPLIMRKISRHAQKTLAIAFLDIDHFKKVNDQYGHRTGDSVLKMLGKVISSETRAEDYCIRYGGEEVVIIGFFEDFTLGIKAIERIRNKFEKVNFRHQNQSFNVTLSAGITAYRDKEDESLEQALVRADQLLYKSKHNGRNQTTADQYGREQDSVLKQLFV